MSWIKGNGPFIILMLSALWIMMLSIYDILFKCPSCCGIFAIKKTRGNDKKTFNMTCPDCGIIGHIPAEPQVIEEEIPEKKSECINFKCKSCGEGVTIWAEGRELYQELDVLSCPFCGLNHTMDKF